MPRTVLKVDAGDWDVHGPCCTAPPILSIHFLKLDLAISDCSTHDTTVAHQHGLLDHTQSASGALSQQPT
jgi:hypothetical protein